MDAASKIKDLPQPLAVAHLGFLDACGFQRSESEDARLTEAADALERPRRPAPWVQTSLTEPFWNG